MMLYKCRLKKIFSSTHQFKVLIWILENMKVSVRSDNRLGSHKNGTYIVIGFVLIFFSVPAHPKTFFGCFKWSLFCFIYSRSKFMKNVTLEVIIMTQVVFVFPTQQSLEYQVCNANGTYSQVCSDPTTPSSFLFRYIPPMFSRILQSASQQQYFYQEVTKLWHQIQVVENANKVSLLTIILYIAAVLFIQTIGRQSPLFYYFLKSG